MNEEKNQLITKEYLDKSLAEYQKSIIEAVNFGFEGVNEKFAENSGEHKRLEEKIDDSWNKIDGYVKAQETFKQEFEVMKSKISRIEEILKEKLGVEIQ